MSRLGPLDMLLIRSWSAVVAGGREGTPAEVAERMADGHGGVVVAVPIVAGRMLVLRASGALP